MAVDGAGDNLARARTLLAQSKFADAEEAARHEIRLDPYSAPAHVVLAAALTGQGKRPTARAAAERAIAIDPNLAGGHVALASAWLAESRPELAEIAARRAVALDPASADAYMVLGNALLGRGATAEADRAFDAAITLEPADPDAERNWKRMRAPIVVAITVAGLLAFEALRLLAERFTAWRVSAALLAIIFVLVVAALIGLAVQRRRLARLNAGDKMELVLESRRRRKRGLDHYLVHGLFLAVAIAGLSLATMLFAVGQKSSLQVSVGDCFSLDRLVSIEEVATIPCQLPHDIEVYAVFEDPSPPAAPYPGIDVIHKRVRVQCEQLYEGYVGVPWSKKAPTRIDTFVPEESYWRLNIRTEFCGLRHLRDQQLVGSRRRGS
jgi:tetratricopeptide (TPR) repeat protein